VAKLTYALICDAALAHPDGKVSMLGAGIDRLHGADLPIRALLTLVFRIEWDERELDEPHIFRATLESVDNGEVIGRMEGPVDAPRGPEPNIPSGGLGTVLMPVELPREGLHRIRFKIDNVGIGEIPLVAVLLTERPHPG
jgi:hypothetical protein